MNNWFKIGMPVLVVILLINLRSDHHPSDNQVRLGKADFVNSFGAGANFDTICWNASVPQLPGLFSKHGDYQ